MPTTTAVDLVMSGERMIPPKIVKRRPQRRRSVLLLGKQLLGLLLVCQGELVYSNEFTTVASDSGGAFFTIDGYDHPNSQNPLCWQGISTAKTSLYYNTERTSSFSSPFDDSNSNNAVQLLPSCPSKTTITAHLSQGDNDNDKLISLPDGTWMGHANKLYQYNVQGTVDLSQWNATVATNQIQIGVSVC